MRYKCFDLLRCLQFGQLILSQSVSGSCKGFNVWIGVCMRVWSLGHQDRLDVYMSHLQMTEYQVQTLSCDVPAMDQSHCLPPPAHGMQYLAKSGRNRCEAPELRCFAA